MALTKTPFLSLGSRGTVGGFLTSQKRGKASLLRAKPIPTDPLSLAQQYQRWLYEDYAYLWTQQSLATRQSYATAGSRYHLTGFQYWMKYMLTNLPDIAGYWKLDTTKGGITPDSSRNGNNGTVIGASPATGLIDKSLISDGINDYITCGTDSTLYPSPPFSCEAFVRLDNITDQNRQFAGNLKNLNSTTDGGWALHQYENRLRLWWNWRATPTFPANYDVDDAFLPDIWYHIALTYDGISIRLYIDGILRKTQVQTFHNLNAAAFVIAGPWYRAGNTDQVILYSLLLDQPTIARHSLRRYPA